MRKIKTRRDICLTLTNSFRGREAVRVNYCCRAGNECRDYVKCFTKSQALSPASTEQLRGPFDSPPEEGLRVGGWTRQFQHDPAAKSG